MSDNFVKRNLKRRYKGVKFSAQQLQANKRRRAIAAESTFVQPTSSTAEDDNEVDVSDDNDENDEIECGIGGAPRTSRIKVKNTTLPVTVDFSDPLHKTLAWMSTHPSRVQQGATDTPILNSILSKGDGDQKDLRGLHVLGTNSGRNKAISLQDALSDSRLLTTPFISLIQQHAPTCPKHQMTTVVRTVRKSGSKHRMRRFFGCSQIDYGSDQTQERCNFFCWVEEHPPLLALIQVDPIEGNTTTATTTTTSTQSWEVKEREPKEVTQWLEYSLSQYRQKLIRLEKDELLQEVKLFNRRRQAMLGNFCFVIGS